MASTLRTIDLTPKGRFSVDLSATSRWIYSKDRVKRYGLGLPLLIVFVYGNAEYIYGVWFRFGLWDTSTFLSHHTEWFAIFLVVMNVVFLSSLLLPLWMLYDSGPGPTRLEWDESGLYVTYPSRNTAFHPWRSEKTQVLLIDPARSLTGDPELKVEVHLKGCHRLHLTPELTDTLTEAAKRYGAEVTRVETTDFWLGKVTKTTIRGRSADS